MPPDKWPLNRTALPSEPAGALVELETETGKEYWIAFNNFYVITRYNRSPLYAMAVYQLAQAIRELRTQEESI
jgi:membrane-bound lytic murein transglycosylase B